MTACDTSFLFSLYGNDVHSPKAIEWVTQNSVALHLNCLIEFEFANALRFAEFRKSLPPGTATQYLVGFEAAIAKGRLIVEISNLADVVDEAKRISSIRTLAGGHRGFDILHVASALKMGADQFLTFDKNQKKLAETEGLAVPM